MPKPASSISLVPYETRTITPVEGVSHSGKSCSVHIRLRYEMLDQLNAGYLADPVATNFTEYMHGILTKAMAVRPVTGTDCAPGRAYVKLYLDTDQINQLNAKAQQSVFTSFSAFMRDFISKGLSNG